MIRGAVKSKFLFALAVVLGLSPFSDTAFAKTYRTTQFSLGRKVGGPDERQDYWTNRGYTSTGKNLTPGVVAIDDGAGNPLGTIFKNPKTGECYIAADRHGNSNEAVIDVYLSPPDYGKQPQYMALDVWKVGTGRKSVGATVEAVREQLKKCGKVPPGESAVDWLRAKGKLADNESALPEAEFLDGVMGKRCFRMPGTEEEICDGDRDHSLGLEPSDMGQASASRNERRKIASVKKKRAARESVQK